MRRVWSLLLAVLMAGVVFGGTFAKAATWGCQEINVKLVAKSKAGRKVCYPCIPSSSFPAGTPVEILALWDAEVCPLPSGDTAITLAR